MIKSNPCKLCQSTYHTLAFCPLKPKKAIPIRKPLSRKPSPSKGLEKLKKKKKPTDSRSKLVKKLDDVFSKYIRYSAVESDGMVQCVTCPTRLPPQNMQNGHYQTRGDYPTRWLEDNCHPQCVACNVFRKGNYTEYAIFMVNTYGAEKLNELKSLAKSGVKIPTPVIRDLIAEYTEKLKAL